MNPSASTFRTSHGRAAVLMLAVFALTSCTAAQVTTKPTASGATSSSGSSSSVASSPLTDGSGSYFNLTTKVTVPAGGSLDFPLIFEQSPSAQISVYAGDSSVSATFGGTSLSATDTTVGRLLSATPSNPADGSLHLVNPGTSDASVTVAVQIETSRHLALSGPTAPVANGATVSFEVDLTGSVAGDVVQAEYIDPAGTHTPISLTPAGSSKWTGQVTPTAGGKGTINAWTTANGVRYANCPIDVTSGTVTLSFTFTERLSDTNNDGLAEALVLSPTITVAKAGTYQVSATLTDAAGNPIVGASGPDTASGYYELTAGSQPLDLSFNGSIIYKAGISGPYHLTKVSVALVENFQTHPEARVADMGATQAYDYHAFQH
jgi:hypothetical protein